jgi:hypothetical protein
MLKSGKGICSSYTQLFRLLADELGLESSFAIAYEIHHAWNLVCVEGNWYNIDVTWNDRSNPCCYLLSDAAMKCFHSSSSDNIIKFVTCTDTRFDKVNFIKDYKETE